MKCAISVTVVIALLFVTLVEAQTSQSSNPPQLAAPSVLKPAPSSPTLQDGTPVKLRLNENLSSASAHVGQTVEFEVLEEVKVSDLTIVPKAGIAWATVTEAHSKKSMGRAGVLSVNIDSVRLADGEKAALRAVEGGNGGGHIGAMTGAMVATTIVFWPAAPLFLFMHGKDITIPKGSEVTAFINGDVPITLAKFQSQDQVNTAAVATLAIEQTTVEFTSTPQGADIELDGAYVGSTPSTEAIASGEHTVRISKTGYKAWERKLRIIAGHINIAAQLEQEMSPATTSAEQRDNR